MYEIIVDSVYVNTFRSHHTQLDAEEEIAKNESLCQAFAESLSLGNSDRIAWLSPSRREIALF